ncbi:MAG: hypothetical protein HY268_09965 [Deltaproteobacteria bacterium]|nr:hypothetical protein [Deltaproteobacteria bacterium]
MDFARRQTITLIVAVVAVLGPMMVSAQIFSPYGSPPVVRMTGTFSPFDEKQSHGLNTLTVIIEDKQKWLFKVNRVDTMTGTDPGMMLLTYIFPPELRLMGAASKMALLAQPDIVGKPVSLQGFLYIDDRDFYVAEINVATETANQ